MKNCGRLIFLGAVLITALCTFLASQEAAMAQRDYLQPVEVSPNVLVEAYKDNFHAADATSTGKLLIVTGRRKNIRPAEKTYNRFSDKIYSYITLDAGPGNQPIVVYFWDWEAAKIFASQTGSSISVMGFCQGVLPQLSIIESCVYPDGCGGPVEGFEGPYFKLPPTDRTRPRR
jgi:hypothetical protein